MTRDPMRLRTADDLARDPAGEHCELVAGVLRVSEPPGGVHGHLAARLAYRLQAFVETHRLGVVLVEAGFILRRRPDTVRGPDVAFVSAARCPSDHIPEGFFDCAPDLAVEIRSPRDLPSELAEKAADYLDAGAQLVWILDPLERRAAVYRPGGGITSLTAADRLDGADVVPGFHCPLAELFPNG
ncbi:MAG: Uma2 family endonuclease [Gemmatimonadales bacterium]